MFTKDDLKVGVTYRAKHPKQYITGEYNDRTIIWVGRGRTRRGGLSQDLVQYDGPAVHNGRRYPTVTVEQFLKWAGVIVEETR